MADISREDILKLAKLSKLSLSEEELESFTKEIDSILDYVEQLASVDVSGLEPTSQVTGLENVAREDKLESYGVSTKELLSNAPALEKNQLKVKRVLKI